MPKPFDYLEDEIVRVAEVLEKDPKFMTRTEFLKNSDVSRRDIDRYGGWGKVRFYVSSKHFPESRDTTVVRKVELINNINRKKTRIESTRDYLFDKLSKSISYSIENSPRQNTVCDFSLPRQSSSQTIVNVLLSDLHFGVDVKPNEVLGSEFNWEIAAQRLSKVCLDSLSFAQEVGSRRFRVYLAGDIIHGIIHLDDINIKPITEQFVGALHLLSGFIKVLRESGAIVDVVCVPGNHDRPVYRSSARALAQRWDTYSHCLYTALQFSFREDPRVSFIVPTSGLALIDDTMGGLILASHGDVEPEVGNVSKKIDTESLKNKFFSISSNSGLNKNISVALFGHWHVPTVQMLNNGSVVVVNGSLIGTDTYAQNACGFYNSVPAQVMFTTKVRENPFDLYRIVKVREADHNKKYNVIPAPIININGDLFSDVK